MSRGKVIVAMSGGVDSSLTAALLKEAGYEVIGVTLHLWCEEKQGTASHHRACCSVEDQEDARRVCHLLDIPHYVLNFQDLFQNWVVDYFCREYSVGRTPNPCIACNQHIKFRYLLDRALALGADYLATGHYARIDFRDGSYHLHTARDTAKDQSYVLFTLGQEELARLLFPLGEYTKPEVRRKASALGLPVSSKPDSQEICFLPDGDYRPFLDSRLTSIPGDIMDTQGKVLGKHRGIAFYTIGQRHGLGFTHPGRYYVTKIDASANSVVVGSEEELLGTSLSVGSLNWIAGTSPPSPIALTVKYRYRSPAAPALLWLEEEKAKVHFVQPQRALTPGQAAVFYQSDEVLGGGIIEESSTTPLKENPTVAGALAEK